MRSLLLAAALTLTATSAAVAQDQPSGQAPSPGCFFSSNWSDWSAPGEGDTLYLRVRSDIYRLDLAPGTHVHKTQDRFLVNNAHGGNWICSAQDLDLRLRDQEGFSQPIIGRTLTKLSAEEVAAIPHADLP